MSRLKIDGDEVSLLLLSRNDLELWLENSSLMSNRVGIHVDAGDPDSFFRRILQIKIDNMMKDPGSDHWYSYFAIVHDNILVGTIGSKGCPDSESTVEVGYGISEAFSNRGYATKALRLFSDFCFNTHSLRGITAETLRDNPASQRVLEKNGFRLISDDDTRHWRLDAPDFGSEETRGVAFLF